jgi:putative ABC transport system substrate-binding protein
MANLVLLASLIVFAACSPTAWAQSAVTMAKIGYLTAGKRSSGSQFDSIREKLREAGYIEGKNVLIEPRFADQRLERLPELAADLVRRDVDVIMTGGPSATRAAKQATSRIPIVMVFDPDPVQAGFVASLARPGGNITGNSSVTPELIGKQIELLKAVVPRMSRVAFLGNSTEPGNVQTLKAAESAASALGLQLVPLDARGPSDIEPALDLASKAGADGIVFPVTSSIYLRENRFMELVEKRKMPATYYNAGFVVDGGLMAYTADPDDLYRRAAIYVDKILKGAKASDLPVEMPAKFILSVNLKAAKKIGLTFPPSVIARADKVID